MGTTTKQKVVLRNILPGESGLLLSLPFPALIFSTETLLVTASNSQFGLEQGISVYQVLFRNKLNLLSEQDIFLLSKRIINEGKIQTQRIVEKQNAVYSYDIHISLIPGSKQALFFISENIIHKNQVENTNELFLKELVQSISEGIGIIDEQFHIIYCNKAFARIFGKPNQGIIGESLLTLAGEENRSKTFLELENVKNSVETIFELHLSNACNPDKFIMLHALPRFSKDKRFNGMLLTLMNITDRVQIERELVVARDKALQADRLKSTFLANMSHEIRTPMNSIIGFSSMLKKGGLTKKKHDQFLDIIISRGKLLMDILNDIIDITKIEENQIQLNITTCNLRDLINELTAFYENEITDEGKDIKFTYRLELPGDKSVIKVDTNRLHQVLSNLISNAVKFTEKGIIEIGFKLDDSDTLLFSVKDSGIGIPFEIQDSIFERFRQADESFTRSYGGTGLGLTICKGLLQLMGGNIWVESDGKNGSAFYFTLPYYPEKGKEETSVENSQAVFKYQWKGKNILIIEDDPSSFEYLYEVLSFTNCDIHHVSNGEEALRQIYKHSFDIILLDIQLPEIDGYHVAKTIRQSNPAIPIIAQTALAMSSDRIKCMEAGCSDYLTKPLQFEKLLDTIHKYFEN